MENYKSTKLDNQQVELIGRNDLVSLLITENIEVALPLRDHGIDLLAFVDIDSKGQHRVVPIQLKTSSNRIFSVHRKYKKFPGILMAYVWYATEPSKTELYIMTYKDAEKLADQFGWTTSEANWISKGDKGGYSTSNPSKQQILALEPYLYKYGKFNSLI